MASLVLQQVKELGAVTRKINTECDGCNSALQKIKIVQRVHVL